jgi:hypothetical protein
MINPIHLLLWLEVLLSSIVTQPIVVVPPDVMTSNEVVIFTNNNLYITIDEKRNLIEVNGQA